MSSITADLACINRTLEKIIELFEENPYETQCLLTERPELMGRIQEIVDLLRALEEEPAEAAGW
jgi:predicted nuclease with TOPRIM domain